MTGPTSAPIGARSVTSRALLGHHGILTNQQKNMSVYREVTLVTNACVYVQGVRKLLLNQQRNIGQPNEAV